MMSLAPLTLVLPLALSAPSTAPASPVPAELATEDDYAKGQAALRAAHLERLEELAKWCQKEKAFRQRDSVYELILAVDPDHAQARKYLRYTKDRKTGKWLRKRPYREPKAGKPEVVQEYHLRRSALDEQLVEARVDLVVEHSEALGDVATDRELRAILDLSPDHPRLRKLLGFIRVEGKDGKGRWTTQLAQKTEKRREAIMASLEKARKAAPKCVPAKLDATDRVFDIQWDGRQRTDRVRVLATTNNDEAERVARTIHAAWDFLPAFLGIERKAPEGLTIYLIQGRGLRANFIDNCPGLSEERRERLFSLGGGSVPGMDRMATWSGWPVGREDMALKSTTVNLLEDEFGITTDRGWLVEGLGLYVNQIVLGTKYTRHVAATRYVDKSEPKIDADLNDPNADWLEIAADYMQDVRPTRLAATFGRNTSELSPADVVLGYAFVAFLREAHGPEILAKVLRKVGAKEASAVVAIEEILGAKLPAIQRSFRDWLDQVGSHPF